MSRLHRPIELLAPVGSPEALTAAVRCGADAVYLGAGRFHARQNASPFDEQTLADAVAYCHARGVKVHMTLNTLVREEELEAALDDAARAARLGIDALIVQDRGLAAAVHRAAPDLVLHASTQLSCHTPAGVKELRKAGFSRVVLAREMTEREIKACCDTGVEIETFVHGALCMSVSGQCFLSAMLGGRSGNRGRCAQPCRLPFCVGKAPTENDRALSLKDLSLCDYIARMQDAGVASLKIEGRMKRPEYVAAAVSVCRAAIDGTPVDTELWNDLQGVFSRSGFTDGYFVGKRTIDMFGSRTKDDVLAASGAQKRLAKLYLKERAAVPLYMTLSMKRDVPMTLTVEDEDGHTVCVTGEPPRQSETPLSIERCKAALAKLGGTPYYAAHIAVNSEDGTDTPLSLLNALRRDAVEKLTSQREVGKAVSFEKRPRAFGIPYMSDRPSLVVRLADAAQMSDNVAKAAALVTVPLSTDAKIITVIAKTCAVGVEIPRGLFSSEAAVKEKLVAAKAAGAVCAVCHNVGALPLCREAGLPVIGGFGLHVTNSETCAVYRDGGLAAVTASFELSARQMSFSSSLPMGMMAYGRLPLMLLRNCPASAAKGCKDCKQDRVLIDRKGVAFPLMCQNGCADLLNSVPLYLADRVKELPKTAFWTLYMTDESSERVAEVTAEYAAARTGGIVRSADEVCKNGFTRGLLNKGVE